MDYQSYVTNRVVCYVTLCNVITLQGTLGSLKNETSLPVLCHAIQSLSLFQKACNSCLSDNLGLSIYHPLGHRWHTPFKRGHNRACRLGKYLSVKSSKAVKKPY